LALPVLAAGTPAEIIKQRQETMKGLGSHMKAIKGYAIDGTGSAEDVARRASEMQQIAMKIPSLFPEGTGMDEIKDPETGAKPEIWLDWENFEKSAAGLDEQAKKLQAAASSGDQTAIRQAFQSVGKNGCGHCHESFRQKLQK
jgi:cytochrome c556